jgi:general stress protein 26
MPSLKERILEVVKTPALSGFATITTYGKPWVRYVVAHAANDLTFRLSSFREARKVAQIEHNPEVHLTCGITDPTNMGPYLQVQGRAVFTTDREERHAFWNEKLRLLFAGPDDPKYGVVIVRAYRIELCHVGRETEVWERNGHG